MKPALSILLFSLGVVLLPAASRAAWPVTSTTPLFLCNAGGYQFEPVAVADGTGGVYVAWTDSRDGQKIRLQHWTSAGNIAPGWPADGYRVGSSAAVQRAPALALDGQGGVFVAWEEPGPLSDWNLWIQRVTSAPSPAPGWTSAGVALCTAARNQVGVRLLPDGEGGCTAAWLDERSSASFTFVYALRITPQGARVPGWPPNGRSVVLTAGAASPVGVTEDGTGGFFVCYANTDSTVHVQRMRGDATYAPGWPVNDGLTVGTRFVPGAAMVAVPDGQGGVYVAWSERDVDANVKVARFLGDSSTPPGWTPYGVSASSAGGDQLLRGGVPDGQYGVILVWDDARNASTKKTDIYGVRFTADGYVGAGWTAEGSALDGSTSDDRDARIVPDGLGGALVVYRSGNFATGSLTLVAQRVAVDGTRPIGWSSSGNDVGVVAGRDAVPSVVWDGISGVIPVWTFENTGTPLARLTRMDRSGKLGAAAEPTTDAPETPTALALAVPSPNPCRTGTTLAFTMARDDRAVLDVIDAQGRRVQRLWGGPAGAGTHRVWWDATGADGRHVAAGVYFVALRTPGARLVRRVVVTP